MRFRVWGLEKILTEERGSLEFWLRFKFMVYDSWLEALCRVQALGLIRRSGLRIRDIQ